MAKKTTVNNENNVNEVIKQKNTRTKKEVFSLSPLFVNPIHKDFFSLLELQKEEKSLLSTKKKKEEESVNDDSVDLTLNKEYIACITRLGQVTKEIKELNSVTSTMTDFDKRRVALYFTHVQGKGIISNDFFSKNQKQEYEFHLNKFMYSLFTIQSNFVLNGTMATDSEYKVIKQELQAVYNALCGEWDSEKKRYKVVISTNNIEVRLFQSLILDIMPSATDDKYEKNIVIGHQPLKKFRSFIERLAGAKLAMKEIKVLQAEKPADKLVIE